MVTLFTMHLLGAIPNAGKYLELSIEEPDYYPWQEGLFARAPYAGVDGKVTIPERAGLGRRDQTGLAREVRAARQRAGLTATPLSRNGIGVCREWTFQYGGRVPVMAGGIMGDAPERTACVPRPEG